VKVPKSPLIFIYWPSKTAFGLNSGILKSKAILNNGDYNAFPLEIFAGD
jgi:hypothetical protein